jgi:GTPase
MNYSIKHTGAYRRPGIALPALIVFLFAMLAQPTWADDGDEFSMRIYRGLADEENGTLIFGNVKTGIVNVGDTVCVPLTTGENVPREVVGISMFSTVKKRAEAGNTVGLLVEDLERSLIAKKETLYKDCERSKREREAAAEKAAKDAEKMADQPALAGGNAPYSMQIYDVFSITGQGTVVYGIIKSGAVMVGNTACVPLTSGEVMPRTVTAIERSREIMERAETGQTVGLLMAKFKPALVAKDVILNGDCEPPEQEPET